MVRSYQGGWVWCEDPACTEEFTEKLSDTQRRIGVQVRVATTSTSFSEKFLSDRVYWAFSGHVVSGQLVK